MASEKTERSFFLSRGRAISIAGMTSGSAVRADGFSNTDRGGAISGSACSKDESGGNDMRAIQLFGLEWATRDEREWMFALNVRDDVVEWCAVETSAEE